MEYLDIYDEQGQFLGKEERKIVHEKALWHNTVHCWLYDEFGNIYFQIRKDKNKLYTTASGHVLAGETIKEAFGREIKEELGYQINYENAELITLNKFRMDREEKDGSLFRDRAFANVYACLFEENLSDLDFQEEELNGIVKINARETLDILTDESGDCQATVSYKEEQKLKIKKETIYFEDFLVNPGEKALEKYGEVLNFILKKVSKK